MNKNKERKLKGLTINEFSDKASQYDAPGMFEMVKEDYEVVIEEVESEKFESLIDYGCGTGEFLKLLSKRNIHKNLYGIDITPNILEVARKKNPHIKFYLGDSEEFVIEGKTVDVVTCIHSFHHYPSPADFLKNAKNSLNPGGRLIIRDNSSRSFFKYLFMNFIRYPISHIRGKGDVHFYSEKEVYKLCTDAGFKIDKIEVQNGNKLHCVVRK